MVNEVISLHYEIDLAKDSIYLIVGLYSGEFKIVSYDNFGNSPSESDSYSNP